MPCVAARCLTLSTRDCALPAWACVLPCAAYALPCAACPCLCSTLRLLRGPVCCLCLTVGDMHVLEPMPLLPTTYVCPTVPQRLGRGAPMAWPWPPFSFTTRSPLKEHFRPFSKILEETSNWLRRYNGIFT